MNEIVNRISFTSGNGPRYRQLVEQVEQAIASGKLLSGTRLPSERDLAHALGVSRTTTLSAYAELASRGLVRRQVGRGTYVSAAATSEDAPLSWRGKVSLGALRTEDRGLKVLASTVSQSDIISFATAVPAQKCVPADEIRNIADRLMRKRPNQVFGLSPTEGAPDLRETLARRFRVAVGQTLVLNGAQQGLDLISRCLIDPGDAIVMDRPGYIGAIQTFRAAGAVLVGWDVQSGDLESFEDLLVRYRPKFFYTTPSFQNPTGQTMPAATRAGILEVAARYRVPVVEDDPYRNLSFGATVPRSLFDIDQHELVIQLGTVSKTIAGGLRLGWLIANEMIVDQLSLYKQRNDVATPTLQQLVVAEFLSGGQFEHHLVGLRAEHHRRYVSMCTSIERWFAPGQVTHMPVDGGMYFWCRYRAERDSVDLLADARMLGVAFLNGEACYPDTGGRRHMRLCFSSVPPEQIDIGIQRLAGLLHEIQ